MTGWEAFLAHGGLPMVSLAAFVEGDSLTMVAGALAHRGLWSLPGAALAAAFGAFVNDQLWFHVGRHSRGHPRIEALLARPLAQRLAGRIGPRPIWAILGFRFVWGTRIMAPLAFGATGVGALHFLILDLIAVLVWGAVFTGIGFGLGAAVERLIGRMDLGHHLVLVGVVVAAVALVLLVLHRRARARAS